MTNPAPQTAALRFPVPRDLGAVYEELSTDYYPWTEVLMDLERREQPEFNAVLHIEEAGRWARFIWAHGALLGGISAAGQDVPLDVAMRALPRARVSLRLVGSEVAEMLWACRARPPKTLPVPWPEAEPQLTRMGFSGVLIGADQVSYWLSGRVLAGRMPPAGSPCVAVTPPVNADRANLVGFWQELVAITQRTNPAFSDVWRQVSVQQASQFPVLDPFGHEVEIVQGRLVVDEEVTAEELRPAMLAAYQQTLSRLGLRLQDLPLSTLSRPELWRAAGLEAP